jgi:hypothetical protein
VPAIDDSMARASSDGERVFTGDCGAHAAIGGQASQALIVQLEQEPGGHVMRVGRQSVGAEPVFIVSRWAGHYDAAFTMKTYVHATDDDLRQGTKTLARIHEIA